MPVLIRPETPSDHPKIHALTTAAFPPGPEATIIDTLRSSSALLLSLVAIDSSSPPSSTEGEIIGHVAFSPVAITPPTSKTWVGLGPISVAPDRQRQGIARQLIETGLSMLKDMDVQGCVLLGSPDFYGKFGFKVGGLRLEGVPEGYFLGRALDGGDCPVGAVRFDAAFDETLEEGAKEH